MKSKISYGSLKSLQAVNCDYVPWGWSNFLHLLGFDDLYLKNDFKMHSHRLTDVSDSASDSIREDLLCLLRY